MGNQAVIDFFGVNTAFVSFLFSFCKFKYGQNTFFFNIKTCNNYRKLLLTFVYTYNYSFNLFMFYGIVFIKK